MTYLEDFFALKDKVAVVTGGGGTLPGAMAYALIKAGVRVSLWGRGSNTPISESVRNMKEKTGCPESVTGETVDTGNEEDVLRGLKHTEKEIGKPEILINGVGGVGKLSTFGDLNIREFNDSLRNNLMAGCVVPSKVFSTYWIANQIKGAIINIASMTSFLPLPGTWPYNVAKAGIINMTKSAANELAQHNIRVNAIAPGFFIGKQNKHLLIKQEDPPEYTPRGTAILGHIPAKKFGSPEELSGATLLLASNKASGYITGICIPVDGGYLTASI